MNKKVLICNGIGNRINQILNYADELDKITFVWSEVDYAYDTINGMDCGASWEDLFSFPKLNIIYDDSIIDKDSFHDPSSHKFRSGNFFEYEHDKSKLKAAQQFIKSLVPSKQVAKLIPNIPEGTCGYAIRHFHTVTFHKVKVPNGSFLTTDSEEQRLFSPKTIQTRGVGGKGDKCINILGKQGVIRAIADWFCLFKCEKIIEIGPPFVSLGHKKSKNKTLYHSKKKINVKGHSTFIDAHRILGYKVFNLSNKSDNEES